MADINPIISIITINMEELSNMLVTQRMPAWIKKHDPTICYLQQKHFRFKDIDRFKAKGWKRLYPTNNNK